MTFPIRQIGGGGKTPWFLEGGVSPSLCVAAYQALGATKGGSYVNLANPGRYTLVPYGNPIHDPTKGWTFNGTNQRLDTGIAPTSSSWTLIVRFADTSRTCVGSISGNSPYTRFYIYNRDSAGAYTFGAGSGSEVDKTGNYRSSNVFAISNGACFTNGVSDGQGTGSWSNSTAAIQIGCLLFNSTYYYAAGTVQAVAIYSGTLTNAQIAAISDRMLQLSGTSEVPLFEGAKDFFLLPGISSVDGALAGTIDVVSTFSGSCGVSGVLAGNIDASSSFAGETIAPVNGLLEGSVATTASLVGDLTEGATGTLAGSVDVSFSFAGRTCESANSGGFYLNCDGEDGSTSFVDTYGCHPVVAYGNAQVDTAQKKYGTGSLYIPGAGDYLQSPDNADWDFGSGDFTIQFWMRFSEAPELFPKLLSIEQDSGNTLFFMQVLDSNLGVNLEGGGVGRISIYNEWTFAADTWVHVALTRYGNVWTLWVDGVEGPYASQTLNYTIPAFNAPLKIGDPDYAANVWIDDILILKGTALYTEDFTPSGPFFTAEGPLSGSVDISSSLAGEIVVPVEGLLEGNVEVTSSLIGYGLVSGELAGLVPVVFAEDGLHGVIDFSSSLAGKFGFYGVMPARFIDAVSSFSGVFADILLEEQLFLSSSVVEEHRKLLQDSLVFSIDQTHSALLFQEIEDGFLFADILKAVFQANLSEGLLLQDDVDAILRQLALMEEILSFNLVQGSNATFVQALVSAALLSDLLHNVDVREIADTAAFSDSLASVVSLMASLLETAIWEDTISSHLTVWGRMQDAVVFSDALDWTALWHMVLEDVVVFSGSISLDGTDYVAWVLNPSNKAFSSYSNFPFNSFVQIENQAFGIADDGIYLLEGEDDDGEDIEGRLRMGLMDFGSSMWKNVRHAYLGIVSGGENLILRTVAIKEGSRVQDEYVLKPKESRSAFEARAQFSNAVQARYWSLEVESTGPVEIESIELGVILLPRKR